jgi:hypothetical protein
MLTKSFWLIAAIAAFALTSLAACFEEPANPYYYNHSYGYGGYSAYRPTPNNGWWSTNHRYCDADGDSCVVCDSDRDNCRPSS